MHKPLWVRWHAFIIDKRVSNVCEHVDDYVEQGRRIGRRMTIEWVFGGKLHALSRIVADAGLLESFDVESMFRERMRETAIDWLAEQG